MIVSLARVLPAVAIGSDITDFATGLAVGLMIGVLVTWKNDRAG
jgi:hypothetical protein